jgi:hypothetical protein
MCLESCIDQHGGAASKTSLVGVKERCDQLKVRSRFTARNNIFILLTRMSRSRRCGQPTFPLHHCAGQEPRQLFRNTCWIHTPNTSSWIQLGHVHEVPNLQGRSCFSINAGQNMNVISYSIGWKMRSLLYTDRM